MSDKTEKKQKKGRQLFERGTSGNPNGRPKGTRNKALFLLEQLIEEDAVEICKTVISLAKGGDLQAVKILIDRILPPKKDRPVSIKLLKIEDTEGAKKAASLIFNAMAEGEITPMEGEAFIKIVEAYNRSAEIQDYEERLKLVEEKLNI